MKFVSFALASLLSLPLGAMAQEKPPALGEFGDYWKLESAKLEDGVATYRVFYYIGHRYEPLGGGFTKERGDPIAAPAGWKLCGFRIDGMHFRELAAVSVRRDGDTLNFYVVARGLLLRDESWAKGVLEFRYIKAGGDKKIDCEAAPFTMKNITHESGDWEGLRNAARRNNGNRNIPGPVGGGERESFGRVRVVP